MPGRSYNCLPYALIRELIMVGIGDLIKPAQEMLAPLGGTLGETWQALIGDKVAAWRLKNAVATYTHIQAELQKAGLALNVSKIPDRYAFAWFEEATKQDDSEIQTLFARLLARAAAGDADASDRRHLVVVGQMTPCDAQVFYLLFDEATGEIEPESSIGVSSFPIWDSSDIKSKLASNIGVSALLSLEHLVSLGIITVQSSLKRHKGLSQGSEIAFSVTERFVATRSGLSLYLAVRTSERG